MLSRDSKNVLLPEVVAYSRLWAMFVTVESGKVDDLLKLLREAEGDGSFNIGGTVIKDECTLLIRACEYSRLEAVEALLNFPGIDIKLGLPLSTLVLLPYLIGLWFVLCRILLLNTNIEILEFLIEAKVEVNLPLNETKSSMLYADSGSLESFKAVLLGSAYLNYRDTCGNGLLPITSNGLNCEITKFLIMHDANPDLPNKFPNVTSHSGYEGDGNFLDVLNKKACKTGMLSSVLGTPSVDYGKCSFCC